MVRSQRLFSNLTLESGSLTHQPTRVISCMALVAGTTVGAGALALPAVTLPAGVLPSTIGLLCIWAYTLIAGFLIAEVNVNVLQATGKPGVGLLAMIEHHLGRLGVQMATLAYLFLHYALLVAYVSEGGHSLTLLLETVMGRATLIPAGTDVWIFILLLGSLVYFGSQRLIALVNNLFLGVVLISFLGLMLAVRPQFDVAQVSLHDWAAVSPAIPVMLVALFYHNIIPVVTTQLEGDIWRIRQSLIWGSGIPLFMFLSWNILVLCSLGPDALTAGFNPLDILRQQSTSYGLGLLVTIFSEFAIATSFIGVSYGLLNVFRDLWRSTQDVGETPSQRLSLYALVLLPPVGCASFNPDLFITALSYAGTFAVSMLYGFLPAVLAWRQRYQVQSGPVEEDLPSPEWVPGGRWMLGSMMAIALGIVCFC